MGVKGIVIVGTTEPGRGLAAGDDLPAARHIANRPIVCHVLDALRGAGVEDVAIVGPRDAIVQLKRRPEPELRKVTFLRSPYRDQFFGLLASATEFVGSSPCIVHRADGLAGQSLSCVESLTHQETPDIGVFVHHGSNPRYRLGRDVERLLGITELTTSKAAMGIAGVGALGPGALQRAYANASGDSVPLTLPEVAERVAEGGGRLHVGRLLSWRRYDGDPRDLLEMNRMILDRLAGSPEPYDGEDIRIEGRVEIDPTACIRGSVINGPAVIGPGARISDSYVGPYTSIGRDVEIDGAEIERSIVADGARIRHVGMRIEGSTVGRHAHIFRDFGLPRAVRMHVGEGIELALD